MSKRNGKRPVLATVEKFLQPIVTSQRNIMLTGYAPPYRQKTIDLIQSLPQQTDAFIVRVLKGFIVPNGSTLPSYYCD